MLNARAVALKILIKIEQDQAYSNLELQHSAELRELDARDAAFAGRLVYGVLERKLTLDYRIAQHCSRKLNSLSVPVLIILRMSVYQIFYLDRVPECAAVNEAVNLTKRYCKSAAGFVNGVLRSILRGPRELSISSEMPNWERLSVEYSVHPSLAKMLLHTYGDAETVSFLKDSLERPPIYLRVNSLKTTTDRLMSVLASQQIAVQPVPGFPDCLLVTECGYLAALAAYQDGLFYVQDLASQLCCRALDPQPGEKILDVCAAPGGKTFTIAGMMHDTGMVLSGDCYEQRVSLIRNGAARLGLSCIRAVLRDAVAPENSGMLFDRVLCDVPCSGFGVIRRKPEVRYHDVRQTQELLPVQQKILESSSACVRPGGVLVYSTCTLNPQENAEQTELFLKNHPEFQPVPLFSEDSRVSRTFLPQYDGSDGFFVAKFIRRK